MPLDKNFMEIIIILCHMKYNKKNTDGDEGRILAEKSVMEMLPHIKEQKQNQS